MQCVFFAHHPNCTESAVKLLNITDTKSVKVINSFTK